MCNTMRIHAFLGTLWITLCGYEGSYAAEQRPHILKRMNTPRSLVPTKSLTQSHDTIVHHTPQSHKDSSEYYFFFDKNNPPDPTNHTQNIITKIIARTKNCVLSETLQSPHQFIYYNHTELESDPEITRFIKEEKKEAYALSFPVLPSFVKKDTQWIAYLIASSEPEAKVTSLQNAILRSLLINRARYNISRDDTIDHTSLDALNIYLYKKNSTDYESLGTIGNICALDKNVPQYTPDITQNAALAAIKNGTFIAYITHKRATSCPLAAIFVGEELKKQEHTVLTKELRQFLSQEKTKEKQTVWSFISFNRREKKNSKEKDND